MADIWFWQRIISPHMAGLAVALGKLGHRVTYVVEQRMSASRASQGWSAPDLPGVSLHLVDGVGKVRQVISDARQDSVHICQGLRANGLVGGAQQELARRGLQQWVIMETVDDEGWTGLAKRALYRIILSNRRDVTGILANGWRTAGWLIERGFPDGRIFPFAYFLPEVSEGLPRPGARDGAFVVLFVGRFIEQKRLGILIRAVAGLASEGLDLKLLVVGSGPQEDELRSQAEASLGDRLEWLGRLPHAHVRAVMSRADCLVLPSRHDGWGAVVSEALLEGTPAIASDACGSAGIISASGVGGVFRTGDTDALREVLRQSIAAGKQSESQRQELASWARCLGAEAGAQYLAAILSSTAMSMDKPLPPWQAA